MLHLSILQYIFFVAHFYILMVHSIRCNIHIKFILIDKGIHQIFQSFNLSVIQPHVPTQSNTTHAFLEKMDYEFLITDDFCHLIHMSYWVLRTSIFSKFCTLNFLKTTMFGVKNISAAFTRSYRLDLLIAFNLSYQNRRQLIKILVFFITFAIWVSTFRSTIGAD